MQVTINNELIVEVVPNEEHEWLLSTKDVAEGYGLTVSAVQKYKDRYPEEFIEGKHWLLGQTVSGRTTTMWTKRGVVRLGFMVNSEIAKEFRDWAEDYIIEGPKPTAPALPTTYLEALKELVAKEEMLLEYKPKVETYDAIMDKSSSFDLRTAGNTVGLKTNKLSKFLWFKRYIYKHGSSSYKPYKQYLEAGYFTVKIVPYNEESSSAQLRVTSKGVELLRSLADEYDVWHKENYGSSGRQSRAT